MLFPARSPFLRAWLCTHALGLASAWPPFNRDTQVDKRLGDQPSGWWPQCEVQPLGLRLSPKQHLNGLLRGLNFRENGR